jgi:hypothetical protein
MSGAGLTPRLLLASALAVVAASLPLAGQPSDDDCLVCHGDADLKSGQGQPRHIDAAKFAASIHGSAGISCVDCHADLAGFADFPHGEKLEPVVCVKG